MWDKLSVCGTKCDMLAMLGGIQIFKSNFPPLLLSKCKKNKRKLKFGAKNAMQYYLKWDICSPETGMNQEKN